MVRASGFFFFRLLTDYKFNVLETGSQADVEIPGLSWNDFDRTGTLFIYFCQKLLHIKQLINLHKFKLLILYTLETFPWNCVFSL